MRIRLALTLDVHRDRRAEDEPEATQEQPERPPMVDGKGAFVIERSHQDEPNEMRAECRLGFQPNEETP